MNAMITAATPSASAAMRTLALAGFLLAIATALGAFGTHALQPVLPTARFAVFETGVSYQFFHALGLLGIGVLRRDHDSGALRWAARLILIGMLFFCGSLYSIALAGPKWLGMVAPIGGTAFMAAWLVFGIAAWRSKLSAS